MAMSTQQDILRSSIAMTLLIAGFRILIGLVAGSFSKILGRPCPRCSIRRPIICSTSSTKRLVPVNWPRCKASRSNLIASAGMAWRKNAS